MSTAATTAPTIRLILTSANGRPWTVEAFKQAWTRAFLQSEIAEDLHFHDIRGTAVTMLAEAGCTVPEIATITGHTLASVDRILERYLKRTKALAESAIGKLAARAAALKGQTGQQALSLADAIEDHDSGDGMHLGPTDLRMCATSLRLAAQSV